jgi:hypothetical protein
VTWRAPLFSLPPTGYRAKPGSRGNKGNCCDAMAKWCRRITANRKLSMMRVCCSMCTSSARTSRYRAATPAAGTRAKHDVSEPRPKPQVAASRTVPGLVLRPISWGRSSIWAGLWLVLGSPRPAEEAPAPLKGSLRGAPPCLPKTPLVDPRWWSRRRVPQWCQPLRCQGPPAYNSNHCGTIHQS